MSLINLISIPFVVFFAWAKGRGLIRWALISCVIGFWSLLLLLFVKTKPIKIYQIPQQLKDIVTARSFKKQLNEIKYPVDLQKDI